MARPSEPRPCRDECGTQVVLARRDVTTRWVALEAREVDQEPGALVLVDSTAWRPSDLVEHFMARFEIGEPKARDLVAEYPSHRIHHHEKENTNP